MVFRHLQIESNDVRYKLASALIDAAASLAGDGCGEELDDNPEYTRGQVELICDMLGLPMDYKEDVINEINLHATARGHI